MRYNKYWNIMYRRQLHFRSCVFLLLIFLYPIRFTLHDLFHIIIDFLDIIYNCIQSYQTFTYLFSIFFLMQYRRLKRIIQCNEKLYNKRCKVKYVFTNWKQALFPFSSKVFPSGRTFFHVKAWKNKRSGKEIKTSRNEPLIFL